MNSHFLACFYKISFSCITTIIIIIFHKNEVLFSRTLTEEITLLLYIQEVVGSDFRQDDDYALYSEGCGF
jgi:hypothetical protein